MHLRVGYREPLATKATRLTPAIISAAMICAHGTQLIPVTVYASVLDIVASVVDLMHTADTTTSKGKQLPYTLRGTVGVSVRGFHKETPFVSTGELSLKGLALPR